MGAPVPLNQIATQTLTAAGLNLIGQGLTIFDSDLRLAVSNAPFQEMFELPDHLVETGTPFETTIRHLALQGEYGEVDDVEVFVTERARVARAFEPHYMERTRANGRIIAVEGSPLPQGGWITVYTDITSTKKQEALLRARSEELSDQVLAHAEELASTNRALAATVSALGETKRHLTEVEARTRLTTEMMPAHIAHIDETGHYTYSNRRLSTIVSGRPNNIVGLHISDALGADVYAKIKQALVTAFNGESTVIEFTDATSANRIRVAFTPDERGGVYILSMDVTKETQARVALQQTRKRELAAQLTSGLAHDFSNLLTIILGMQSKIARLEGLPEPAIPLVEGTLNAAKRGGELLGSIAEITTQRVHRPRSTYLQALLDDTQTLAAPSLPADVEFTLTAQVPDAPILLDQGAIQDALLNLILNARDACGSNGEITLDVSIVHETWVQFTVSDTGTGFSPEALEHGCDPFFTTKGSEGTGLGLPMVYDITKLGGGDLRLFNAGNQGASVRLRLPLRYCPEVTDGLALLVEDNDELRTLYREMLTDMGYSVIEATSADEATALIANLPDIVLILSDIRLNGKGTGLDLLKRIDTDKTPVVLMTSLPQNDPLHQAGQAITTVLSKPFTPIDLANVLQSKVPQ
jgi:signal transduction histidine kinase